MDAQLTDERMTVACAERALALCARYGIDAQAYADHPHRLADVMHDHIRHTLPDRRQLADDLVAWLADRLIRDHGARWVSVTGPLGTPIRLLVHEDNGLDLRELVDQEIRTPPVLAQRMLGLAEEALDLVPHDCGC